jgi:hypothetical protein
MCNDAEDVKAEDTIKIQIRSINIFGGLHYECIPTLNINYYI